MEQYIIAAIITIIIGFFSVYGLTPIIIKALEKRNVTVIDAVSYTHLTLPTNREV